MGNDFGKNKTILEIGQYLKANTTEFKDAIILFQKFVKSPVFEKVFENILMSGSSVLFLRENYTKNVLYIIQAAINSLVEISEKEVVSMQDEILVKKICKILSLFIPYILSIKELSQIFLELNFKEIQDLSMNYLTELITKTLISNPEVLSKSNLILLFVSIIKLLFKQGISLPNISEEVTTKSRYEIFDPNPYLIWHSGFFIRESRYDKLKNTGYIEIRVELLRLLLIMTSSNVYLSSSEYEKSPSIILYLLTYSFTPHVKTLFFSLFNFILSYDWKGIGIPFLHTLQRNNSEAELVKISIELLLVMIDYSSIKITDGTKFNDFVKISGAINSYFIPTELQGQKPIFNQDLIKENIIIKLIHDFNSKEEFDLIYEGLSRLFENIITSYNSAIPNTYQELKFREQIILLFFRISMINYHFITDLLIRKGTKQIILSLLIILNKTFLNTSDRNFLNFSVQVLLLMSEVPEFGHILSKIPFTESINFMIPSFSGSYLDLMILIFHKIIEFESIDLMDSKYALFIILRNIAPGIKNISIPASLSLLNLLSKYSSPNILINDIQSDNSIVNILIDIIGCAISLNYESNSNLVYCSFLHGRLFKNLSNLSYKLCINQINVQNIKLLERKQTDVETQDFNFNHESKKEENKIEENKQQLANLEREKERKFEDGVKNLKINLIMESLIYISSILEKSFIGNQASEEELLSIIKNTSNKTVISSFAKPSIYKLNVSQHFQEFLSLYLWEVIYKNHTDIPILELKRALLLNNLNHLKK